MGTESQPPRFRAWCRLCREVRPLDRIYWWPSAGAHFGECAVCGNTVLIEKDAPAEDGSEEG